MTPELLAGLALFCFVGSITPGPNNMMLLSSGLTFGFRATLPHMLGVAVGFMVMVGTVGLGLDALFTLVPHLHQALQIASVLYLLWLAWKIARAGPVGQGADGTARPMTFLQAAAFQWVNPKAWVMVVTAFAAYAPKSAFFINVLWVTLVFGAINFPCISVWVLFGDFLRRYLRDPALMRWINLAMALALVASIYPLLAEFSQP